MKLKLTKGSVASQDAISGIQQKIGMPLASDYLEFIGKYDGAQPENNIFKIGTTNESGVNGFIPVGEITSEMLRIENLPHGSFPVAWAEGGNYVLVNQAEGGTVLFWDHEQPQIPIKLASSFRSFLEQLEPFDVSSIKLKPGQVKRAWIDPDFLKGIQD